MTSDSRTPDPGHLRRQAESRLHLTRQDVAAMSTVDVQELVHELQVHQIELEMQNEAVSQAHLEADAAREEYQELYDEAPVGYLSIAEDDTIVKANLMAGRLLGVERDDLLGRTFSSLIDEDSGSTFFLHRRAAFRNRQRVDCQVVTCGPDPVHLHLNSQAKPGAKSCRTILTDITVLKKLEARHANLAETAQAANRAKSQFLANMSHEVRTPLNAIVGLGSLLQLTPLDAEQAEYVSTLRSSSEILLSLVNDLLDFTKLESAAVRLESRPFDLGHVLADVRRTGAVVADAKNLPLSLEIDPDMPRVFRGDAFRLRQIVSNLVANAVKFTSTGSVRIQAAAAPAIDEGIMDVTIRVIDTGIGIPEDKRESIFESFTQADASTTRRYGGTGLGLSIARRLAQGMGGNISISDNADRGSVFCISLPLPVDTLPEGGHDADETTATVAAHSGRKPCILLVEDFPANVVVATAYLRQFGYDVDVRGNGRDAVEAFENGNYALILMDLEMPEMDGLTAARHIRHAEESRNAERVPILAIAARVLPDTQQHCLDSGMDGYIAKPFNPAVLQRQLAEFI
jgi:PAS domain S-box-containing protein